MNLPELRQDHANHVLYGAACGLLCMVATHALGAAVEFAPYLAAAGAALLGAAKELADYIANQHAIAAGEPPPHGVEVQDFACTTAGGLVVMFAAMLGALP